MHPTVIRSVVPWLLSCCLVTASRAEPGDIADVSEKTVSASPDGRFLLVRSRADSGERGEARKAVEIRSAEGRVLYRWTSPIGSAVALWSPDSAFLAVNDSPGDMGDQLRVFRLDGPSVIPAREPDGRALRRDAAKRHGNFLSTLGDVSLSAIEWREGRLWCRLHGDQSPRRQPSLRVPFHDLWVFSFPGGNTVLEEVWSRTEPPERVVRKADAP